MADRPLIAGQYRLIEEIGRGGFGAVWQARDEQLHRDVAAKQLFLPAYLTVGQRRERHDRSLREARSAARLHHPNAVTVHDVVTHDDTPWIIMEYVPGRSLDTVVEADGPLTPLCAAEVGLAVVQGLRAAHAAGVIHRDVKPANVLIGDHRVVLTDFGIAVIEGDDSLTQSGLVMGAPAYTSPERARGEPATAASDLWSLGATLYFAVEGRRPFPGQNPNAVFHAVITDDPVPPTRSGPLAPIIAGLLRKSPAERMTSDEAAAGLAKLLGLAPPSITAQRTESPQTAWTPAPRHRRRPGGSRRKLLVSGAWAVVAVLAAGLAIRIVGDSPATRHAPPPPVRKPRLLRTIPGTGVDSRALAFGPQGLLAIGYDNGRVMLWDSRTQRPVRTLNDSGYSLFGAAFSPDGKTLAVGGYDGVVRTWNVAAGTPTAAIPAHGTNTVDSLTFTPDGRRLVIANASAVRIWNLADRRLTALATGGDLYNVAGGSSGGIAVTDAAALWYYPPGRTTSDLVGSLDTSQNGLAFAPDGSTLAGAGANGEVCVWDLPGRRRLATLNGTGHQITAVAFNRAGTLLAAGAGTAVLLWNTSTYRKVAELPQSAGVEKVAFSPDGAQLAVGGDGGAVALWSIPEHVTAAG